MAPKPTGRKKDLRKLGEWIEAKRKADAIKAAQSAPAAILGRKKP
jgi:hypothetical protein